MRGTKNNPTAQAGFTIVELLIVIVVIAILAMISIVAYSGIQNRAYDSAVQSDLRSVYNAAAVEAVESDTPFEFPPESNYSDLSENAYLNREDAVSFVYGSRKSYSMHESDRIMVAGISKSGKTFVLNNGSVSEREPWSHDDGCVLDGYFGVMNGNFMGWSPSRGWSELSLCSY